MSIGRVTGLADVYAAGDGVDFPVKQGGLAAQQADAVAEHIAAALWSERRPHAVSALCCEGCCSRAKTRCSCAPTCPAPTRTFAGAWYPLWWPPTKIAGRYLAPYLFERGEEEGLRKPPAGFVDVDIPLAAMTLPG